MEKLDIVMVISAVLSGIGAIGVYFQDYLGILTAIFGVLLVFGMLIFCASSISISKRHSYNEGYKYGFKAGEQEGFDNAIKRMREKYK